ncbi:MAG: hypothetical protein AAB653_02135 [Patescibacteria group bacterium]
MTNNNQIDNSIFESKQTEEQPRLGKRQKIAAGVLVVFGICIFIAWTIQLKNNINGPFIYKQNNKGQSNSANSNVVVNNSEEALKTKDTDGDGLSDWDELNIYHTSPYLADSDSDGISDKQEVENGTDPNCPQGRDCGSSGIINGDQKVVEQGKIASSSLNSLLDQSIVNQPMQSPAVVSTTSLLSGQIDAATLRQLLIQSGMAKDVLDKISDNDLMKSYEETLNNPAPTQ